MNRDPGTRRPPLLLVGLAFTVSGFTSLVLEVVWSKALTFMLGSTLHAMSTVVAGYLGGLALGAYLAGRWSHRVGRPLAAYGLLEIAVGAYAFLSLPLLAALDPVLGRAYASLGAGSPAYFALRIGLAAAVLIVPTVCMGATLPFLVAWATRSGTSFGRSLGRLYGLNTLGAVLGSALAGFALIPNLGLLTTTWVAGVVALVVGLGMALLGRREPPTQSVVSFGTEPEAQSARPSRPEGRAAAIPAAGAPRPGGASRRALAIVLFGLSGAVALVLEITWARVFNLIFGSSVYSFALVLASYLLALALGSLWWGGRLADGKHPWRSFALLQAGVSAGAVLGLWLLPELPGGFLRLLITHKQHLPLLYLSQMGLASLVTFVPCLALGALFPVGTRLLSGDRVSGARATGLAYAVNTAGTLTGTLLAGFWLLPTFGIRTTWVGSALVSLVLGAAAWWAFLRAARAEAAVASRAGAPRPAASRPGPGRKGGGRVRQPGARRGSALVGGIAIPATALVLVALAALLSPPWNKALFTLGAYRTSLWMRVGAVTPAKALEDMERRARDEEDIIFYREGLHGVVSVHQIVTDRRLLSLRVNGKPDASTGADMATQIMSGHLPMLWAPPKAHVCVIGQGSGVTTRAALLHDPARVTVVEIERAVNEASRFFDEVNDQVLDDPRAEYIIEDGRQHLQHSGRTYDVIISEPSNPWIAGVNNLFTVDFYRRVRAALRPGGVFCQFVQSYELSPAAKASLLASYAQVFPNAEVFAFGTDLLLLALPEGKRLPGDRLILDGARGPVASYLARFGLAGGKTPAAHHMGRVTHLVAQLPAAPLNTDDRPYVEYRAPFDLYRASETRDPFELAEKDPLAGLERWVADSSLVRVATVAGLDMARQGLSQRAMAMAFALLRRGREAAAGATAIADLSKREEAVRLADAWAERAAAALEANNLAGADQPLQRAFQIQPDSPRAHLVAGRLAMRRDRIAEARQHLVAVLRHGGNRDSCLAYNNLGIIEMREGRRAEGRAAFEAARAAYPGEPTSYVNLARWHVEAGGPDSARVVLEQGIGRAFPAEPITKALEAAAAGRRF